MPRQYTILGRPIPRLSSRRLTLLLLGLSLFALAAISTLPSKSPSTPSLSAYDHRFSASNLGDSFSNSILNPFRQPSHAPPRQKNDTYDGSSWWADWKWLSVPFSSSLTLDENRALLPPLKDRPYIYCYYDSTVKKSREEKDAESELLLTWRRAWWAQGFRPVILSSAEAVNNPTYAELQRMEVDQDFKADLMRWLAWETMGGGILSQYTVLPMAPWEDTLLSFLRRGEYPDLTTWNDLNSGLLAGSAEQIKTGIQSVMGPSTLKKSKSVVKAMPSSIFKVDTSQSALAYYSAEVIQKKYAKVAESINNGKAKGLAALNRLVNSHLHVAWQNSSPDGIDVLKPLPERTTMMVKNAFDLAQALSSCPDSPMPSTCPPNIPKCQTCVADSKSLQIQTPADYRNSTRVFTIGTVPHPWTLATVTNLRETLDIPWIRRESSRDTWIITITQKLLGKDVPSDTRVMHFKQAVAEDAAVANNLWLAAEADLPPDVEWHFGFALPKLPSAKKGSTKTKTEDDGKPKDTKKSKNKRRAKNDDKSDSNPQDSNETPEGSTADRELRLLERAKKIVHLTKSTPDTKLRASLEAWNLADTEAWKFARAFLARRSLERSEWEKEEAKYVGGAGSEGGRSAWSRWRDRKGE